MKANRQKSNILCALAVMAAAGAGSMSAQAQCTINLTSTQQTIDGYGFSTAWCPTLTSAQGAVLFGTGGGQLGFSMLRCRIDPTESWSTETANASMAHSYGAKVMGSAWTPPASMKSNNNTVGGTLNTSQYGAYASYLKQAATSIGLDYVSMQNEPDANVTYESCSWTGSTMETWCANNAPAVSKPIIMPESEGFNYSYSDPTLNNSTAVNNVSIIAGHLYGVSPSTYQNALNHGKHTWMTEHYYNGTDIGTAMTVAKEMSDCMNDQFSAYFWWWIEPNDPASFLEGTTVDLRGYVMGQFAKWIRPGSTRVSSTYNPQSNVYVTAYNSGGKLIIVALNMGTGSVNQQFNIQNGNASSMEGYRTSSSQSLSDIGGFTVSGGSVTATLTGQSVTTFVQTGSSGGLANGTYVLVSQYSGMALDNDSQTGNGAPVVQWSVNKGTSQQWQVTSEGGGYYQVVSSFSGEALDNDVSTANGTAVWQWAINGGTQQRWAIDAVGSYYKLICEYSGKALDNDSSTTQGTAVVQWTDNGGNQQHWSFNAP